MACTLLLPIMNRHVTAPRFNLMARILLHNEHEYGSWYLTTVLPTCTYCPTYRQDLAPIRLRNDPNNPSCRYAYDPVAYIILLPELTSFEPYCYLNRQALHCTATRTDKLRADSPTEPALAPYCHRQEPAYDTNTAPHR